MNMQPSRPHPAATHTYVAGKHGMETRQETKKAAPVWSGLFN